MKFLIATCLFCFSFVALGEDANPALAGTTSVLATEKAPVAQVPVVQEAKAADVVVVSDECSDSDCRIRRRALGRGYVVVKHSVSSNSTTSTREVIDNCCNTVRSKTVTKTRCGCDRGCKRDHGCCCK